MGQIKFRVWDKMGNMIKPFTLHELKGGIGQQFTCDCPVMQYTGLKDKNGVEIYEGDIVQNKGNRFNSIGIVSFIHGCWMVSNKDESKYFNLHFYADGNVVVGNIHQNPELLQVYQSRF